MGHRGRCCCPGPPGMYAYGVHVLERSTHFGWEAIPRPHGRSPHALTTALTRISCPNYCFFTFSSYNDSFFLFFFLFIRNGFVMFFFLFLFSSFRNGFIFLLLIWKNYFSKSVNFLSQSMNSFSRLMNFFLTRWTLFLNWWTLFQNRWTFFQNWWTFFKIDELFSKSKNF